MNVYDSQKIGNILEASHNIELTNSPESADLILLNTCAIREKAEAKMFSDLGRFRLLKKNRPNLIIGVGGCVASQEGEKIRARAPYVDLIFGPQNLHQLPLLYDEVLEKNSHPIAIDFLSNEKFTHFPKPKAEGPSALVTIMEGCNHFCSYCVVPHTRGREISRPPESILKECQELAEQGVREIHLLGQNVNGYIGRDKHNSAIDLADLLHMIAAIDNIAILRFTTSHPALFTKQLINAFANEPKLVNHLHLPVQSGSNQILKAMHRGYTIEEYKEKIHELRLKRPNISISSDFIVGFPGETDRDFQETLDLVNEIKFDQSYSFIYSSRPNTKAALLTDDLPLQEKKDRLTVLQKLLNNNALIYSQAMVGTLQKILVTGISKKNKNMSQFSGRTENHRIVNFLSSENLIGKIITIRITEVLTNSLRGEILSP